jgi:hypothetical protein
MWPVVPGLGLIAWRMNDYLWGATSQMPSLQMPLSCPLKNYEVDKIGTFINLTDKFVNLNGGSVR